MYKNKKYAKYIVVTLCALFIFFLKGGYQAQYAVYGYIPEMAGITILQLGTAESIFAITGVVLSVFAASLYKKFSPKVFMLGAPFLIVAFGLLLGSGKGLMTTYLGFVLSSIACSIGAIMAISTVLISWFGKEATPWISICIGFQSIGGGIFQKIAGNLYVSTGINSIFTLLIPSLEILALLCAFLIKVKPDEIVEETQNQETEQTENKVGSLKDFLSDSTALLFLGASFLAYFNTCVIGTYFTAYFSSFGTFDVAQAATWFSALTILTGLWSVFGVKFILSKLSIKTYSFLLYGCVIISCGLSLLYPKMPNNLLLVIIVITGAICTTCFTYYAVVAPQLFPNTAVEAITKGEAANRLGGIIGPTLRSLIIASSFGIAGGFVMSIVAAVISLAIYAILFIIKVKKEKKVA